MKLINEKLRSSGNPNLPHYFTGVDRKIDDVFDATAKKIEDTTSTTNINLEKATIDIPVKIINELNQSTETLSDKMIKHNDLKRIEDGIQYLKQIIEHKNIEIPDNISEDTINDCIFSFYRQLNKIEDSLICKDFSENNRKSIKKECINKIETYTLPKTISNKLLNIANININKPKDRLLCLVALNKLRQEAICYFIQEVSQPDSPPPSEQKQESQT